MTGNNFKFFNGFSSISPLSEKHNCAVPKPYLLIWSFHNIHKEEHTYMHNPVLSCEKAVSKTKTDGIPEAFFRLQ